MSNNSKDKNTVELSYGALAEFKVSEQPIAIRLEAITGQQAFVGSISSQAPIRLKDLINGIDNGLGNSIPSDIKIILNDLSIGVVQTGKKKIYLVSVDLGTSINLSDLPLVGKQFPENQRIEIKDLKVIYTSDQFTAIADLTPRNSRQKLLKSTFEQGLRLSSSMQFGEKTQALDAPITQQNNTPLQPPANQPQTTDTVKWFDLKKNFGPLYFSRIGVQYQNSEVWFLLDASISAAGLTLTLNGLAVGSSITQFKPKFNLRGLGVQYDSKGALSIAGALLRTTTDGKDTYAGAVIVKTETFTLSALASYTTTDDGHPSLFVYGILDKPLGGPPFFFVTGLALGFAYNRSLILPKLEEIPQFPLVRAAMGEQSVKGLIEIQQALEPYIPPRTGQVMLAIGVKFTSFKIIESFILLVATFGEQFALDVIGISTLTSPPVPPGVDASKLPPPIAQIRLAILARFVPAEGTLKVDGKILPDSFLFERNCQISGGFAFYSWFKGEHEGDFVLTVGGYHPRFAIPAHYPKVDPLSLNWRLNNELTIKGSVYFALTASAIMAGGRLEAVWQSGNLKAWFIANADFIVAWKPYFYDAQISVRVGASYTFDEKILGIRVRKTFSFDIGASVHIWGPEFSGMATIDLKITSFTIAFGNRTQQRPAPISWAEFKQSFLPAQDQICAIAVESGLLRKVEVEREVGNENKKEEIFIVNPKDFTLITSSVIPIKEPKSLNQNPSIRKYDLNLISSSTVKTLPEKGKQLIAIYKDNQNSLEFRIFDRQGTKVVDLKEANSVLDKSTQIEKLKKLLQPYWDVNTSKIPAEDKNCIIDAVTSITGYTPLSLNPTTTSGVEPNANSFGIAPMSVGNTGLAGSDYSISIAKVDGEIPEKALVGVPVNKNVPLALWGISNSNDPNQPRFIENVLSGYQIKPAPRQQTGATQVIDRKNLAYDQESVDGGYQWRSFFEFKKNDEQDENKRQVRIEETINRRDVSDKRTRLLQSLGLSAITDELALLAFYWKWYCNIQKSQSLKTKALDLWFISFAYYLITGRAIDLDDFGTKECAEQAFVISPQLQLASSSS